jgi:ATP-dependent RNA helicase SUPV3L1/SUV3
MKILNLSSIGVHNADNPMTELARQYRQLYRQSIPDFRSHINEDDSPTLRPVLDKLIAVGFGDPVFSKRFRLVKGYESRKTQLQGQMRKLQAGLLQRQMLIQQSEMELEGLKESARASAQQQREYARLRALRKQEVTGATDSSPDRTLSSSSGWSQLLPWLGISSNDDSRTATMAPAVSTDINWDSEYHEPFLPPSNRARKRVCAKAKAIMSLKEDLESAMEDMNKQNVTARSLQFPIPIDDYERARLVLQNCRKEICQVLAQQISERHAKSIEQYQLLDAKTDLTKPWEWFGYARLDRRKIIFHSGPTNSGKTYNALERLKEAKEGLYLGPLRLLAAEVYDGLTADGIYCNLYTGQERRHIPFSTHAAATVEMVNLDKEYDVVVIDEIQMISDVARGAAWTKALLGIRCKEIHVCGGSEARDIVRKLADACGDEFELKEYNRFSPLTLSSKSLATDPSKAGCYRYVQPGDCVVAFSRNDIFAIKREIEMMTNYKCCVIYGKLPPQTRADQARRFNDPDSGYDILVASDAIGMGLNLNIKRVIFNSIFKYNGEKVTRLSHSEIKQISGRAGRRNSPYPHGEVTCRDSRDLPYIRECLESDIPQIKKAALLPTSSHIEVFREGLEAYGVGEDMFDLHKILRQFSVMATVKGDFFLGRQSEMQMIAKSLQGIPLSLKDAYTLCQSPSSESSTLLLQSFAQKLARGEISGLPSRSVAKPAKSFDDLSYLCNLYVDADLFLWLQFKFPPSNAIEHQAALARKESALHFVNAALANTDKLTLQHDYIRTALRHRKTWEAENPMVNNNSPFSDETHDEEDDEAYAAFSEPTTQSYG